MKKQLELNAVPRKRVQLVADEPAAVVRRPRRFLDSAGAAVETEMAHAMKRALAAHGAVGLANVVKAQDEIDGRAGLSGWLKGAALCTGWWEVRGAGTIEGTRLWFDAVGQQWRTTGGSWLAIEHLPEDFEYRGLQQPYEKGYRYVVPGAKMARRVELVD